MWEGEEMWEEHDNGIKARKIPVHKNGCPAKKNIYNTHNPIFYGDD